jgi:hypothetical protein
VGARERERRIAALLKEKPANTNANQNCLNQRKQFQKRT